MSHTKTALVVDDEPQLLRLVKRVFERAGFRTLQAHNAEEARRLFAVERDRIELVLLDVLMPEGDGGAELMPEFHAQSPDLRLILTSGDALPEALAADLTRRGGRFLRKPFVPRTLLRLIAPEQIDDPTDAFDGRFAGPGGG